MSSPPTGNFGMGFCPLGGSLFGFGSPATAGTSTGYTLEKNPDGFSGDARLIDPYTRDYVVDNNGLLTGQSAVAQQVFLAVMTTLGSSVNPVVGSQFSDVKTFDASSFQKQMFSIVQQCLAGLIKQGIISLISVTASQNKNGVAGNVTINWIDNTTGLLNNTKVS